MKIRRPRFSTLLATAVSVLSAGTGLPQTAVEQRAPDLPIYTSTEINVSRYEVVGRPWVDSWRSAFWLPTFPTQQQAIAALQTEAASRGADGLLNVICFDQGHWQWSSNTEPAFLCYGTAIRVRTGQP
jgi:hypothetical protein